MALIEIGSQKQLFVDDYLIESMTNTRQVMNPAAKVEHNPVIRPEYPWEGTNVTGSSVTYDEGEQLFKMRYSASKMTAHQGKEEIIVKGEGDGVTCLATSRDGIHWEKPMLGLVEYKGSKENNIIPKQWLMGYSWQDDHETDPAKRWKGHVRTGDTTTPGMTFDLYYSPDGMQWTPYGNNPIIDTSPRVGRWGPTDFMGWDPIRQVYAVHLENSLHRRSPMGKRLIGRAESPDAIHWSDPETIIIPDEKDPPDIEFYTMPCVTYEGLYVGLLWIFSTTNTTHYPEIAFSRDGIRYQRNYRSAFIERGATGEFDSNSIYCGAPTVHGDQILTFYHGVNWRSPEQLLALGDKATGAIGLAVTPLDGFVSLDGAKGVAVDVAPARPSVAEYSCMVTRSFGFTGTQLHLNLQSALQQWGAGPCEVRVEILTPNHEYIEGFEFMDCDPITTTGLDHVVSWNGGSDLSRFASGPIKLRFYFKNAKLFSFQFR